MVCWQHGFLASIGTVDRVFLTPFSPPMDFLDGHQDLQKKNDVTISGLYLWFDPRLHWRFFTNINHSSKKFKFNWCSSPQKILWGTNIMVNQHLHFPCHCQRQSQFSELFLYGWRCTRPGPKGGQPDGGGEGWGCDDPVSAGVRPGGSLEAMAYGVWWYAKWQSVKLPTRGRRCQKQCRWLAPQITRRKHGNHPIILSIVDVHFVNTSERTHMTIWIGSRSQIWSTPWAFDMEPKMLAISSPKPVFFLGSVCVFSGINSYEKLWLNEPKTLIFCIWLVLILCPWLVLTVTAPGVDQRYMYIYNIYILYYII